MGLGGAGFLPRGSYWSWARTVSLGLPVTKCPFLVPQGRETEWLFGMEEGRKQLAISAGFRRLITVALHRGQQYDGMDSIQAELSARVMELAPAGMPAQQQVTALAAAVTGLRSPGKSPERLGRSWDGLCDPGLFLEGRSAATAKWPEIPSPSRGDPDQDHRGVCVWGPLGLRRGRVREVAVHLASSGARSAARSDCVSVFPLLHRVCPSLVTCFLEPSLSEGGMGKGRNSRSA